MAANMQFSFLGADDDVNLNATDEEGRPSRTWQFSKTKMCKFNLIGMCMKGDRCPFAHDKVELKALPDLTCTKLCKTLIQTGSCNAVNCSYAHTKYELRATSTFHKTKLCRFSQLGHCALGSKCNFAHSFEEIRPLDVPNAPEAPPYVQHQDPRQQALQQAQQQYQQFQQQPPQHLQQETWPQSQQQLLQQQHRQTQQQPQQQLQQQYPFQQQQQQQQQSQQHLQQQQQQAQQQMMAMMLQQSMGLAAGQDSMLPGFLGGLQARGAIDNSSFIEDLKRYLPKDAAAESSQYRGPAPAPPGVVTAPGRQSANQSNNIEASRSDKQGRRRGGRRGKGQMSRQGSAEASEAVPLGQEPVMPGSVLAGDKPRVELEQTSTRPADGLSPGKLGALGERSEVEWMSQLNSARTAPGTDMSFLSGLSSSLGSSEATAGYTGFGTSKNSLMPPPAGRGSSEGNFRDPAYVTPLLESDFAAKHTFLELDLGPIRAPLRPIRSAAGRLDLLGAQDDSGDEQFDSRGPYGLSSSAGLVSCKESIFSRSSGLNVAEEDARADAREGGCGHVQGGNRAASVSNASVASTQVGLSSLGNTSGTSLNEGFWDTPPPVRGDRVNDDMWQVKNTFITLSPQMKPIRSVRTAEGALCSLGSLLDDEP
eukprot:TRINITY_DN10357_c5_g1_i1.p1 TRINITY_DN10357_c5_g1~~TRINITY_DN10357_c5_g1_i1.p1  ORF type:complete len:649 (-),score=174.45 TRINITY_DN10357_c5_g1_i1:322-2268(-)